MVSKSSKDAGKKSSKDAGKKLSKPIEDVIRQYIHLDKKRSYNPPVGLVTSETDMTASTGKYSYDPHLDPSLGWSGKKEQTELIIDTVSLHVHERIDPLTIVEKLLKKNPVQQTLLHYFETPENNPPLREAIRFYKHSQNWSNRLIAGDSLLVMNSLIQKEGMIGKIQMVYIDPPYGIKYGSNFQPFVNRHNVKDGKDEDLPQEPETIKAFRDTWELGIHSYLSYLRDRFLLAKDLLNEKGSIIVQISDENIHLVRCLMDEVFGSENFVSLISFRKKSMPLGAKYLEGVSDYIIWYAKDKKIMKYHQLFEKKNVEGDSHWNFAELKDGSRIKLDSDKINNHKLLPEGADVIQLVLLYPAGLNKSGLFEFEFKGKKYRPPPGLSWKTNQKGMESLRDHGRLEPYAGGATLRYILKLSDYPVSPLTNLWANMPPPPEKNYVVQTADRVVQNCMLMCTDPGDLVFDPTCGSGTTSYVAEKWGRRWITCDTSRVSLVTAKHRLTTSAYDYYELAHPDEGVASGFRYNTVNHTSLGSIANNEPPDQEILYDKPYIDRSKIRISGPFTVEAVPSPVVKSFDEVERGSTDTSLAREGETSRQDEWRMEILKSGIRGKGGDKIQFSIVEPLQGTKWLHADGITADENHSRVVFSFGPQYHPLDQTQVELAIEEASHLVPKPKLVIFAAFQFDPEAAKDIDELDWRGHTILKAQMNTDLLTKDLKKKSASNESFWLLGGPDTEVIKTDNDKYIVKIHGFDYYNTTNGQIESGSTFNIAMWMIDTDYDGRSLYPEQIYFPLFDESQGWGKLAKTLRASIEEELIAEYNRTDSLPFSAGEHKRVAVKILDDRGIESLRIVDLV
jgi:adenine-specific DNA-methyltransferase